MDFQIRTIKHQIAATQRLIDSGCKQYIVQLIELETQLENLIAEENSKKPVHQSTIFDLSNGFDINSKLMAVGTTDEVRECQCCGKKHLKGTVVLKDEWGQFSWFGSRCAHNALNVWGKEGFEIEILKQQIKSKASADITIGDRRYVFITDKKGKTSIFNCDVSKGKWRNISERVLWSIPCYVAAIRLAIENGTFDAIPNGDVAIQWIETYTRHRIDC